MNAADIVNNLKATPGWAGASITTNTTTTSTIVIDSQGFEAVMFALYAGAWTDGAYLLKILETDNADGTTGAAEVAAYQVQNTLGTTLSVSKVGAKLTKRYCTLSIVSTGVTSGCVFKAAIALLGGARNAPVA